ncbi:MAG TPA: hypothetical protein VGL18_07655 [Actinomycetota bacterium]
MREVVQLRIHGVGGNPADGLLGLTKGAVTIRVAGDDEAGFYARPDDPHVQGYVWWKLTSGAAFQALLQALWILLLPFTLFNVANWMFPEKEGRRRRPARVATRSLMFLLGLSLTLSYLLWQYTLLVKQLSYQWKLGGWLDGGAPHWVKSLLPWLEHPSPLAAAIVGLVGVILVAGAVYWVARRSRQDFERFPGPEQRLDPKPEPPVPLLGHPLSRPERLDHHSFWARPRASARLLSIHMLAGTLMFAGLVAWTIVKARVGHELNMRPCFFWLTLAQVALILLMLVLYFVGWDWKTPFKFAPPIMVAAVSVALTTGFFSGFTFWLAHRLNFKNVGLDLDQSAAFGAGSVVFALSLVGWTWWYWHGRRHELDRMIDKRDIPANTAPHGAEPNGASPKTLRRIALFRSYSRCLERIDVLVTPSSLFFLGAAIAVLFLDPRHYHWLVTFGRWELTTLVGIAFPALILRAYKPSDRAKVKSLWDATTFWPRRFHPFAVRPYGERAVPEIQGRLYELVVNRDCRVVVAGHSQGSVLAYCALVHLARWDKEITRNIALVTFGCPLRRMHARYFPAYFRQDQRVRDFDSLVGKLFTDGNPCTGWSNFYHLTDYVGQEVLVGTKVSQCDCELPDPPKWRSYARRSVRKSWVVPADPPQPIFTQTLVHSYYNNSVELRAWVRKVELRLSR